MSWTAIITAMSVMTFGFVLLGTMIKNENLDFLKGLFFLLSGVNTFLLGMMALPIAMNPDDSSTFLPIALAYLGVNGLLMMIFVWYYGVYLIKRGASDGE